jgi:hypothetical protein
MCTCADPFEANLDVASSDSPLGKARQGGH